MKYTSHIFRHYLLFATLPMMSFASPHPLSLHLKKKKMMCLFFYIPFLLITIINHENLIVQFFNNENLIVQFSDQYLLHIRALNKNKTLIFFNFSRFSFFQGFQFLKVLKFFISHVLHFSRFSIYQGSQSLKDIHPTTF